MTAFVLKYRVQTPPLGRALPFLVGQVIAGMEPSIAVAAADATQALHVIRDRAAEFGVDSNRVGMIGFSAGAIAMFRVLENTDAVDRPDFAASVYGILVDGTARIRPQGVPMSLAAAEPDPTVSDAKTLESLWSEEGAPVEMQLFESGDRGFGLGRPGTDSERFAPQFSNWLAGVIDRSLLLHY
ncbi:acetyl esterase/lipase [Microbacterium sp. ZKA21]|uniref:alpha/beta hydrolase n=1 Tax=Microbacterium sp. ZKA21 TaxID=3381694 RepID=UPI003D20A9AF